MHIIQFFFTFTVEFDDSPFWTKLLEKQCYHCCNKGFKIRMNRKAQESLLVLKYLKSSGAFGSLINFELKRLKSALQKNLFICFVVLFSLSAYAQKSRWVRNYPIRGTELTYVNSAIETYDKGFLIATTEEGGGGAIDIRIYKTDVNGNILWERFVGQGKLHPQLGGIAITPEGGFVVEGAIDKTDSTNDNFLMKLDPCGNIEWCKIYDLNQYSIGGPVVILNSGDIIVSSYVAISKDTISNYYDSWTFRTDQFGNIKWQYFDNLNTTDLKIIENQNILRTGYCYLPYPGHSGILVTECGLINIDPLGNRLWYTEYGLEKNIAANGVASSQTSDNGFLTLADNKIENIIMLVKFNANGEAQWTKMIGDTQIEENGGNMVSFINQTYLVSAATNIDRLNSTYDVKILKINNNGDILKQTIFRDNNMLSWEFYNFGVTSDQKFTLAASVNYGGTNDSLMVLKFNENLDLDTFYSHDINKYDYYCNHKITFDSIIAINTNNPVPITIPFPDDTATIINPGSFAIYPNPSSGGIIYILCPVANTSTLATLYDILGRKIGQYNFTPGNLGKAQINPGPLAKGCYVIILEQNGIQYVQKLIVE